MISSMVDQCIHNIERGSHEIQPSRIVTLQEFEFPRLLIAILPHYHEHLTIGNDKTLSIEVIIYRIVFVFMEIIEEHGEIITGIGNGTKEMCYRISRSRQKDGRWK